jgi:hypothetical protein
MLRSGRAAARPARAISWVCTTDAFHGFRRLTRFSTVALAVSRSNRLVEDKAYDAPAGWH